MSTTIDMIALNVPLSQWRRFEAEKRERTSYHSGKNTDKLAAKIFAQLGHDEVVNLVAREFESYPADLRLILRTLCNGDGGSGNVRKGGQRLDKIMGGRLLREQKFVEHFQVKTRDGWRTKQVNPAEAGAARKYGLIK